MSTKIEGHPGKVLLAFPSTGHDLSTRFLRSFVELDAFDLGRAYSQFAALGEPEEVTPFDLKLLDNYAAIEATSNLAKARNRLVEHFLEGDCDWLWFCDTDMVFAEDTLHRLVARAISMDAKILGALCVIVTGDGCIPTLFVDDDKTVTQVMLDYQDNTVCQLAATGTGCLLVHRDVLIKMRDDAGGSNNCWFAFDVVEAGGEEWVLGEDISFCLRARTAGFDTFVDTTTQVGHHKGSRIWWPDDCRTQPGSMNAKVRDSADVA
jgi:hypothetical protein